MLSYSSKLQKLRGLASQSGVLHARELPLLGIPRRYLTLLCAEGALVKIARGIYQPSDAPDTIHLGLAQAAKAAPSGVVCLMSALRFHEIGAQLPHQVWMALDRRAAKPRTTRPVIRWARFSGAALTEGIAFHDIAGARVPIYSPAKTVADCFKYRNKIGLDVALEALREVLAERKRSVDELWKYAKICRVARVMRPYLEALA